MAWETSHVRGRRAQAATFIMTTSASRYPPESGRWGLRGSERQRRHPAVAIAYGAAAALVVDELALLLNLEDVYWAYDGRKSVDAAVGAIAVGATVFAALPFWPP